MDTLGGGLVGRLAQEIGKPFDVADIVVLRLGAKPADRHALHHQPNVDGTIAWFQDPRAQVSAHYVIGREGEIFQMMRDSDKAWHAKGANADSIGIEHSEQPATQ